ncbi:Anaerobic sulfatase-maturating enzyme [uncultured Dysgonomonas sp.]|uniref:Anaerobic sulfatase-maturating enzyme n=1 Tax=uncultured Dysgonomonas sp. TaxID=206096 RepID=A0A212K813_9BACT|nr:anaerobic sulfatase-maturation protein [uncultured Dysgonomonas sp.]SBW07841.1 Anaerobic sulfatase-maturating enzyme [uncultured Dysgonomonas sp.]
MSSKTYAPFAKPLYVMLKPIGAVCNLGCTYCYYLEKKELYPDKGSKIIMSDDLLERFVSQYIEAQTMQPILFTWHGGEPLMRDISFYKKALALQRKYAKGKQISNTLQTNGTLLNDEWCEFFRENNFLIGISIDGAKSFHDKYRTTKDMRPTFDHVVRGINLLKKHGVEYNIMGVVNDFNINYPLEFYQFFKDIDSHYIQLSPAVERDSKGNVTQWSVTPEKWGDFLIAIFNEWVRKDVGTYFVQYFDSALANWVGVDPGICIFAKNCGHAGVMEFNGDVYSCDHFVYPQYKLGNINDKTLIEMMYSTQQTEFGLTKSASLSSQCKQCKYLFACRGECPKNRISKTQSGEEINYLCNGYYKFFEHIAPYMDFMKKELEAQRPPGNIMKVLK